VSAPSEGAGPSSHVRAEALPGSSQFPFSAVVGQDELRLALVLAAVDPGIGGVLARGEKGSAKTTTARGLAAVLGDAPFVELPIGATEDRVVGSIDLRAALVEGERQFSPGLLHAAHGGVLYVDEVNLLADHLVDVLLDVAVSGVNKVEREGVSYSHPSRFVLVGSMNPEEGELRPQLLDRFGLSVGVVAPTEPSVRAEAIERRLGFERDPAGFLRRWEAEETQLRDRLGSVRPAQLGPGLVQQVASVCAAAGAEGLRADLVCCRAAAALAGWEGCRQADSDHVRRVAPLALAHRTRHGPFDSPVLDRDRLEDLLDRVLGPAEPVEGGADHTQPGRAPEAEGGEDRSSPAPAQAPVVRAPRLEAAGPRGAASAPGEPVRTAPGGRTPSLADTGRLVGARVPPGQPRSVAVTATLEAAAARQLRERPSGASRISVRAEDVREGVHRSRAANSVVLAVDASGSMGAEGRMSAAKGAVISLLVDAYERRDRVALVVFRDHSAEVALRPTGSVEVARSRLLELRTGGSTPLAAGIDKALEVALEAARGDHKPLLVLVSDGRATSGPADREPFRAALEAAAKVRRSHVPAVVVDAEGGAVRLGLGESLARSMGARLVSVGELTADALAATIRESLDR